MFKILIAIAPLALSTAAFAQPTQLSDAQYVAAARCQALMSSSELGRQDTQGIDSLLKREANTRSNDAFYRAEQARDNASRAARHAGPYSKAQLIAERDGVCRSISRGGTMTASASRPSASRGN